MMQMLLLPLFGSVTCTPENKGIQFDIHNAVKPVLRGHLRDKEKVVS